jgi:hypothetical protein
VKQAALTFHLPTQKFLKISPSTSSTPIRVNGKHWGGFRTAYKF